MDKWLRNSGFLLLLLVLVVPVSCASHEVTITLGYTDDQAEAEQMFSEMAMAAVLVQAEGGLGSGVVFGDGTLALTAAHVVTRYEQIYVDGQIVTKAIIEKASILKNTGDVPFLTDVTVIKIDPELDLAVLKLAQVYPYGKAKFASSEPYLYQKCWISGHPHGVTDTTITEGRVQALWDDGFIRYSALSTFGNSGGPVWIRENGHYVAFSICQRVHVEGQSATTHLGLGVLTQKMLGFIADFNLAKCPTR